MSLLFWVVAFLVFAIIAGILGFGVLASAAAVIAKVLFFVFVIVFVIMLISHLTSHRV